MNKNIKRGYILMFITVLIWGMDNVLFKSILNTSVPVNILIYMRFIFTTIMLTIVLKIKKEKYSTDVINKNYKKHIAFMSIILCTFYILQVNGLNITKAVISEFVGTTITTLSTILMLSIFIKNERKQLFNKYVILALCMALLGSFLTAFGNLQMGFDLGVLLIIIADIIWGFYIMNYMKIDEKVSVVRVGRDLGILSIFIYTIVLLLNGQFNILFNMHLSNILKIFLTSFIVDVGTVLTYYAAIRLISGVKCSILSLLSPIISFVLAYLWLGEMITTIQFIGCLFLFLASILLVIKEYKENKINS